MMHTKALKKSTMEKKASTKKLPNRRDKN